MAGSDNFGTYSCYYDLFYGDKPYAEEAAFVDALMHEHAPGARWLLELGCGTGRHARELAALGYTIYGVDLSEAMLADARRVATELERGPLAGRVYFLQADARSYRAGRTFDVVISLFHVMSYQTSNDDLLAAFATAAAHLEPGGVFAFDCWFGPAVLTERPEHRVRTLTDGQISVTRTATPVMRASDNVCEVVYDIEVTRVASGEVTRLTETHPMRYLFTPEIELALDFVDMDLVHSCEFGTGAQLGFHTWNACFVARKR
ncbi:MAG: class I SAM-dependent methyltransferase [Coriobacteriia bacterium]|nr:class I SAM-dependent methyltransferase [Coriobacteriia bacterium]